MNKKNPQLWKSIRTGLAIIAALVIYAYGFEITRVNLAELRSEKRQTSLVRVTRALAQPEIFEFEQNIITAIAPIYVPCPADGGTPTPATTSADGARLVLPACANPGETIQVEGFGFPADASGPLRFVPGSDPANIVEVGRDSLEADAEGHFTAAFLVPDRASEEVQYVRATARQNVGLPRFTQTAKDTWDKIIETVFLALLATTLGTILAIPISFFAARNLMKSVRSPLTSISLSILGWPAGIFVGYLVVNWIGQTTAPLSGNILINLVSVIAAPLVFIFAFRWALPQEELKAPAPSVRIARLAVLLLGILVGFYGLYQAAGLAANIGTRLTTALGPLGFLGNFLFQVSDILRITVPALGALGAGGALSSFLGRLGQNASERSSAAVTKILNLVLASAAGATLFSLIGALIEWLYQIGRPEYTFWGPALIGAALGLLLAALTKAKDTLPTGMVIYYVTRTILNSLRSVEALVMAIVFVIAVGIGPFAGVMALGLHTIVSLAKLYSEQVESIMSGPLEAVEATGANRLQTIIYAVVPQIVPPYISYTMYRWDINVRMSTIIGFVGGGGIGFLLQQNINLLNYRAASAQMVAIAIVVASMDYVSSVLREKTV